MERVIILAYSFLPTILFLLIVSKLLIISSKHKRRRMNLPPSPPSLPIIGHLHLLKQPVHRTLFKAVSSTTSLVVGLGFSEVELRSRLEGLSMNILMRMVAGKEAGERFHEVKKEIVELSGALVPGDLLPWLRWIDLGGMEKRMWRAQAKFNALIQGLNDDMISRRRAHTEEEDLTRSKTMIDTLLDLQESEPETYSDHLVNSQIMALINAGTDTTTITIEWAISLLLNHPEILNKARAELDDVVGNERLVEESDYSKLPYFQNIIKETLRLYPAAPLLIPHCSSENCTIGGYLIPKGTTLWVSAWDIHRDPALWDAPAAFRPERHESMGVEAYRLLPFGMGRRSCPGSGLANKVMILTIGALIQCFEWKRTGEELLDMSEKLGLSMPKVEPLQEK